MPLLDRFARPCVLMEKTKQPDGAGGCTTVWIEGVAFTAYPALDTSVEARRAEKEGVTSLYSVLVCRDFPIAYQNYFKDRLTGQTFRVSSNPEEKEAPESASFALKYFTAERKELPV